MLCITFDNFGGAAGDLLPWPCPAGIPAAEWAAYNRIGLELGHPRILKLLDELRIRCTYFAEGYAAVLHPDELLAWHAAGTRSPCTAGNTKCGRASPRATKKSA